MYLNFLTYLEKLSHLEIDLIENIFGTALVLLGHFGLKVFLKRLASKKIPPIYRDQVISEIIPSSLRLIVYGLLAKIWFTGGASIESTFQISPSLMANIIETFYIFLLYLGLKFITEAFIDITYVNHAEKQYSLRRTSTILLSLIGTLLILKVWLKQSSNFSTYFGLLSAGVAIALQDVITSLAGWIYILALKPLKVGDRVQIGDKVGDITDIKLLQFSVLETGNWVNADQPTGRILYFPNSFVFKNSIANYDVGFQYIFSEMPVTITFESDWQKAQSILNKILNDEASNIHEAASKQIRKASKDMRLQFSHLDPKVILSVADSGVTLTLRFLCKTRERRFQESNIWEAILLAFGKENSIDLAYPTTRYYFNPKEGKPETGGPNLKL